MEISQFNEELCFKQYDNMTEKKNHYSINKVLKICSDKLLNIWDNDIINSNNLNRISHELTLKNCVNILVSPHKY